MSSGVPIPWPIPDPFATSEQTAGEAGYSCCKDLTAGEEHDFVKVGTTILEGDEYWSSGLGPWTRVDAHYLGLNCPAGSMQYPVRRRQVPVKPTKWSCGHGRDLGDPHCIVCAVFYRLVED